MSESIDLLSKSSNLHSKVLTQLISWANEEALVWLQWRILYYNYYNKDKYTNKHFFICGHAFSGYKRD